MLECGALELNPKLPSTRQLLRQPGAALESKTAKAR